MKIFKASELQNIDRQTIAVEGISSWDLMEKASSKVVDYLVQHEEKLFNKTIHVICGKGNNGGDGLAIARLLTNLTADVDVFLISSAEYSIDNLKNQDLFPDFKLVQLEDSLGFKPDGIIIDCLFGYGLNKPLPNSWEPIIHQINNYQGKVISIDLPSGLSASELLDSKSIIVKADETLTFQFPKETLLLPDYADFVGKWSLIAIGLNQEVIDTTETDVYYIDADMVGQMLKPRSKFSHKGTFGHVGIVGGSIGKIGAVQMSSKAALRTGCGLVTSIIPRCGYDSMQTAVPEAMVVLDGGTESIKDFNIADHCQAVAIGVGLGTEAQTIQGFYQWIKSLDGEQKYVFDADALNILALKPELLMYLPKGSILSPHPKELKRLIGNWNSDAEKLAMSKEFACRYQVVLIIKGAHSAVICPDGAVYYNSTGNSGMATGGTGDVLTGMLVSLMAQGYTSVESAITGVYLHGLAGDCAADQYGQTSLIASDVIAHISSAFLKTLKSA